MKYLLTIGGYIVALLGFFGLVHILGPSANNSIFGSSFYFDTAGAWSYLVFGVLGAIVGYAWNQTWLRWIVGIVGAYVLVLGIVGLFMSSGVFLGMHWALANAIFNIVIGIWAVLGVWGSQMYMIDERQEKVAGHCIGPNCPQQM